LIHARLGGHSCFCELKFLWSCAPDDENRRNGGMLALYQFEEESTYRRVIKQRKINNSAVRVSQ
jgi:hypothetical protein